MQTDYETCENSDMTCVNSDITCEAQSPKIYKWRENSFETAEFPEGSVGDYILNNLNTLMEIGSCAGYIYDRIPEHINEAVFVARSSSLLKLPLLAVMDYRIEDSSWNVMPLLLVNYKNRVHGLGMFFENTHLIIDTSPAIGIDYRVRKLSVDRYAKHLLEHKLRPRDKLIAGSLREVSRVHRHYFPDIQFEAVRSIKGVLIRYVRAGYSPRKAVRGFKTSMYINSFDLNSGIESLRMTHGRELQSREILEEIELLESAAGADECVSILKHASEEFKSGVKAMATIEMLKSST